MNKKIIKICSILLSALIMMTLAITNNVVKADPAANIRYLTTCVGELPTSININYQIDVKGSTVELSKSDSFSESQILHPTESDFEYVCSDAGYGWTKRIVCKLSIDGLDENTKYFYRVNAGTETSEVMSFRTGTLKAHKQSILWVTDIHASTGWNYTSTVNTELENIIKKNHYDDLRLVVSTGDQIDRSGMEPDEKTFYDGIPYLRNFVQAMIPGNHEFYTTASGSYYEANIFNSLFNNPQNGPETNMNSSYFFKTGDILFLMIDCVKHDNYKQQSDWAKKVIRENPSKWIIMGSHAGYVTAGSYVDDSTYMNNYWKRICEECQVDLCIAGHEHIYIRKVNSYKNKPNEELGITYITSLSSGPKQYGKGTKYTDYDYALANQPFSSNVITVDGDTMTITLYDQNGDILEGNVVTLKAKRDITTNLTDEEIKNSLSYEYADGYVTTKFDGRIYNQIASINIKNFIDNEEASDNTLYIYSKYQNEKMFAVNAKKDNHIQVVFTKRDGKTIETSFDVNNYVEPEYTITYELNDGTFNDATVLEKYKKGQTDTFPIPTKEGYIFKGWYKTETFEEGTEKASLSESDSYNLKLYAAWEEIPQEPTEPTDPSKPSGCGSSAIMALIASFAVISICFVIKKH